MSTRNSNGKETASVFGCFDKNNQTKSRTFDQHNVYLNRTHKHETLG